MLTTRRRFIYSVGALTLGVIASAGLGPLPGFLDLFHRPRQASTNGRDYQAMVATEFIPRMQSALDRVRSTLIASDASHTDVMVGEVDSDDLRWGIAGTHRGTLFAGFIELTDVTGTRDQGHAVFSLYLEADGTEVTTGYEPGAPQPYTSDAGLTVLLGKLYEIEDTVPEMTAKLRMRTRTLR